MKGKGRWAAENEERERVALSELRIIITVVVGAEARRDVRRVARGGGGV